MDVSAYLDRIGYRGSVKCSFQVLRVLHRRHMFSVPFENLDIHLGRFIVLDQASFYNKIVRERRGGYCYELNGCFSWLLRSLGFKVEMLSASVAGRNGRYSPEFDHMTLLVHLKQRWLVDVGFGDSFTEPRQLDNAAPQRDHGWLYQIRKENGRRILSRWDEEGKAWKAQYSFRLRSRKLSDFDRRNRYQQTSPESHFTQGRLISRLTSTGRVTLTDRRLIMTHGRKRVESPVRNPKEFDRLLMKHFQIRLD